MLSGAHPSIFHRNNLPAVPPHQPRMSIPWVLSCMKCLPDGCRLSDSSEELARLHQQSNPVPPHLINAEVSPELDHIVLKVMAKEPAMRYRTADQLGRILENYQAHPQAKHTATTNGSETALPETRVNQAVPVNNPPPAAYRPSPLPQKPASSSNPIEIDWVLIILGLLTVIAVGGLIPFWLWVFFSFNPLIP